MNRSVILIGLFCFLILFTSNANAYELFVWANDNALAIYDPETDEWLNSSNAVLHTLDRLDIEYDTDSVLPDNLSQYDVILVCLGFTCPN